MKWKRKYDLTLAFIAGLILGLILNSSPANAGTVCGERGSFVTSLFEKYEEEPTAIGLASNGSILEILTAPSGSWTILLTRPDGITCVMAAGEAWQDVPRKEEGPRI